MPIFQYNQYDMSKIVDYDTIDPSTNCNTKYGIYNLGCINNTTGPPYILH